MSRRKKLKRSQTISGDRLLLKIQASQVHLTWEAPKDPYGLLDLRDSRRPVTLTVETILPDEYVLAVIEELQHQQERLGQHLPEVYIHMEVARGPIIEGEKVIEGEVLALPEAE